MAERLVKDKCLSQQAMVYSSLGRVKELDELTQKLELEEDMILGGPNVEEDIVLNLSGQPLHQSGRTLVQGIVVPMCIAFKCYATRDYDRAVKLMLPLRTIWHKLGLTHAQADVFDLTLIVALAKLAKVELNPDFETQSSGNVDRSQKEQYALQLARSLASERIHSKKLCPQSWMLYAKVLHECNDPAYADSAYRRALDLGLGQGGNL